MGMDQSPRPALDNMSCVKDMGHDHSLFQISNIWPLSPSSKPIQSNTLYNH